jgi:hypothetical protein
MPSASAILAHRNWWRSQRPQRIDAAGRIPIIIRHGRADDGSLGNMAYAAVLHAPERVVAEAFATHANDDTVSKAAETGRWITVHPNGADERGVPVLIQDNPDGTATVTGGIGGKLNGFRLSLVRSEEDYKAEMATRSTQEKARLKAERDELIRTHGEEEYKRLQENARLDKEQKKAKKLEAAEHLARTVLTAQGIDPDPLLEVPKEIADAANNAKQLQRIREAHVMGIAKHAQSVAAEVRNRVVTALEAQEPVEGVAFGDIVREALSGKSPGYTVGASKLAVERGIVPKASDVGDIREQSAVLRAEGDESLAALRMAQTAKLQAGAANAREAIKQALNRSASMGSGPGALHQMAAKPVAVEDAGAILAAANLYRQASRSKPSAGMRPVAPMQFNPDIEGNDIPVQSIVDELRTRAMTKLVSMSNAEEAAGNSLYSHLSKARYAQFASMSAELLPGATIDPALVDFLGSQGASQLIATAAMRMSGADRVSQFRDAIVGEHLAKQVAECEKATDDATRLLDRAGAPIGADASDPSSVIAAYAATNERSHMLQAARQRLGEARGKVEATASAINACEGVLSNPDRGIQVVVPGGYNQVATAAAVIMPGLTLGEDYTIVSPQANRMAIDIAPQGVEKLLGTSGLVPDSGVAQRLAVVRESARVTGVLPDGLRREVNAMSPVHGVAETEYGNLTPEDRAVIRTYWAQSQGINAADECDPFGTLRPEQEQAWRLYQHAIGHGLGDSMMQSGLEGRFDSLSRLDFDDDQQVVDFGRTYAEILGMDVVRDADGNELSIPTLDARKTEAGQARFLRPRIRRLMRTLWATTQGADYFDPASVKPVSQAWSDFVAKSSGDMAATQAVQQQMILDPEVMVGRGVPLKLTHGQERMISMIINNRRMAAGLGAGAGKTLVMMGSFAQLHTDGKASRALVAVPSAVVGQFESEWNKFVDPRYGMTIHAAKGDARKTEEALAGGADFVVMTHEGLRQKLLSACAKHMDMPEEDAAKILRSMPAREVDPIVHDAMAKENWHFDYFAYDEGHKTLGRAGKEDSLLSILLDSAARRKTHEDKLPYYVFATADPAKNDVSELHSLLGKIDPDRFNDGNRDQFVRSYGRNTQDAAIALRNAMSPYVYTQPADVPVKQTRDDVLVPLTPSEQRMHDGIQAAYHQARLGRALGQPNMDAEKMLGATNPKALALARDNAISRGLLWSKDSSKAQWVRSKMQENKGRGTVIFARNRASVEALKDLLQGDGHKVETLTGSDSGMSKRKKREAFQNSDHDILICTDAAEAGMNLQRGNLMVNFDVPMTAKTLEQRIARQVRMGQTQDVDVYNLVSDCHWDRRNLDRLKGKGTLREIITSPFELADDTGALEESIRSEAGV